MNSDGKLPIYCLLGAFGDICAMLPLFMAEFKRTGKRQAVIVSKTYASIFEGTSYVVPIVLDGKWNEHEHKYDGLDALISDVVSKTGREIIYLNPVPSGRYERLTPSYITEMWRYAGRPEEWDSHPLVFDQRDSKRENELCDGFRIGIPVYQHMNQDGTSKFGTPKPVVLIALDGRTSPFQYKQELVAILKREFSRICIVDLSEVVAHRLYDIVGMYEKAKALITIDTCHMHLSRASNVPVFAYATDTRGSWHGSPNRPRFAFYARYKEFEETKGELIRRLRMVLNGEKPASNSVRIQNTAPGGYNPSIIRHDGKLLMAYRWHPQTNPTTRLTIAELDDDFCITSFQRPSLPKEIEHLSTEDPRLFHFQGELWMSYTAARLESRMADSKCVVGYGKFHNANGRWTLAEHIQPQFGRNDWSGMEKNWVFFGRHGKLFAIYQGIPNQVVIELNREKIEAVYPTKCDLNWPHGQMHGGTTPMPFKGKLLRFFHSRTVDRSRAIPWKYYIGACLMNPTPPFETVAISSRPILEGFEWWEKECHHHKQNVVFPGGSIIDGENILLSYGVNDCSCYIATLKEKDLNL